MSSDEENKGKKKISFLQESMKTKQEVFLFYFVITFLKDKKKKRALQIHVDTRNYF